MRHNSCGIIIRIRVNNPLLWRIGLIWRIVKRKGLHNKIRCFRTKEITGTLHVRRCRYGKANKSYNDEGQDIIPADHLDVPDGNGQHEHKTEEDPEGSYL